VLLASAACKANIARTRKLIATPEVDFDPEIPNGDLELPVAKQELDGAQIARPAVYQRGLGATEGVRSKEPRIQANACYPGRDQASVLSGRDGAVRPATARKQVVADVPSRDFQVRIYCFPGLLCEFELHGVSCLALADAGSISRYAVGSNVLDFNADDVTPSQLAVDSNVEHRKIACLAVDLKLGTDRPHVLGPQGRLGTDQFALVPGDFACRRTSID
jgi:hypothetical protein